MSKSTLVQLQDVDEQGKRHLLAQRDFDEASFSWDEYNAWARDVFTRHEAREPWVVLEPSKYFFIQGSNENGETAIGERGLFDPEALP